MASNNQFRRRRKKVPKIAISPKNYGQLTRLGRRVVVFMTGNAAFPTPVPTLASVTTAIADVEALIVPKGQRNTAANNVDLYAKCLVLLDLLIQLQQYVVNTVGDDVDFETLYLSSGFRFQNVYSRTAKKLQPIKRFRQPNTTEAPYNAGSMKWSKPRGLIKNKPVQGYNIYEYNFVTKTRGDMVNTTTKTTFAVGGGYASGSWFQVVPFSVNGEGRPMNVRIF